MCHRDGRRKLTSFILLLKAGIFSTWKKRGDHNPFFLRKQKRTTGVKLPPNNSIGGSARHWLFPPPWRHISFLVFASLIWEIFFFLQAKHEQSLSGKWRLNFTWRFLPASSSGTQVSGSASVSWGISPTACSGVSVLWKVSETRRKWSRVSMAV